MNLTAKQKQLLDTYDTKRLCDFLSVYPHRYDVIEPSDESTMRVHDSIVIEGQVVTPIKTRFYAKNKSVSRFNFLTKHNEYAITIFNRPWLKTPARDRICTVVGKLDKQGSVVASNVYFKPIHEVAGIFPVYPLKKGVTQKQMVTLMKKVLVLCEHAHVELFPNSLLEEKKLLPFLQAQQGIHQPNSKEQLQQAIATIKYVEFFNYHLSVLLSIEQTRSSYKKTKIADSLIVQNFMKTLSFELTDDQLDCVDQIIDDLKAPKPMMRLLQGDVGSGKTIVALIGAIYAIAAGYQVALLAPTEILASQHYYNVKQLLHDPTITVGFLSASSSASERKDMLSQMNNHQIDLVVGTHALFQESVSFAKLGFVITDEQHRFGVMQRQAMNQKGNDVDVLSMSATPIPRTLANALFSELDVSTIESLPSNRQPIQTKLIQKNSMIDIMDDLTTQINNKHQVFVVCPAIDSNVQSTRNVVSVFENLKKAYGSSFVIAMVHGQMDAKEKETVMDDFKAGRIDMLVSTTIIEVGIDIANANRLVVYDADRFGLSQLHQLRGRIGRSHLASVCYLLTSSTDETVLERLQVLVDYQSGFKIAYYDLIKRGPGEIVGVRQSGLPSFSFGNIVDDQSLLLETKQDAATFLSRSHTKSELSYIDRLKNHKMQTNAMID